MFRKAKNSDIAAILELNNSFVPKVGKIDRSWLEKYVEEADFFEVAAEGDKVLGYIIGMLPDCDYTSENFLWFKKKYSNFLYIDRIAIAETAQGRGIGKSFYNRAEEQFAGKVTSITCEVNINPPNPQSYEFHRKIGFCEVGQQDTKAGTIRVAMLLKEL